MKPGVDGNAQQPAYVFCEDKDDDDVFCLFESYQTQGSFEQASESSRFADYMARIGHMLNGPPVVNLTTPAWGKGVSDQDMQRIS